MTERHLKDFLVGHTFGSGWLGVDAEWIESFATEFDPRPFHFDEGAASNTIFRRLAASGWHTAALTMRLLVEGEVKPAGGIVGAGGEFSWPSRRRTVRRKPSVGGAAFAVVPRSMA